jgi:hypothetical protein
METMPSQVRGYEDVRTRGCEDARTQGRKDIGLSKHSSSSPILRDGSSARWAESLDGDSFQLTPAQSLPNFKQHDKSFF